MSKRRINPRVVSARNKKRNNHKHTNKNIEEKSSKRVTKDPEKAKIKIDQINSKDKQQILEKFQDFRRTLNNGKEESQKENKAS